MLSLVIPALLVSFGIDNGQAGLIGSTTLIASAIGGWIAGALSERFGRVRVLELTVLWFSVFAFGSGFAHSGYPVNGLGSSVTKHFNKNT